MKLSLKPLGATFGALILILTLTLVPRASAACGSWPKPAATHASWNLYLASPRMLQTDLVKVEDLKDPIVGLWHVKFVAESGDGPPKGVEFDAGYAEWHSDGTEIMNSGGRSPTTSAFCVGVWKKTADCTYKLNHFAAAWNDTGTALIGPANIREDIVLDRDGSKFAGTFTIVQYDETGVVLVHIAGNITGTRIDVDTAPSSIF